MAFGGINPELTNKKMKLYKQTCGNSLAIGISGTPAEIKGEINALFNWNICGPRKFSPMGDTEFQAKELSDRFAYVWTDAKRLERGLRATIAMRQNQASLDSYKGKPGGAIDLINSELKQTLENITEENFIAFESAVLGESAD